MKRPGDAVDERTVRECSSLLENHALERVTEFGVHPTEALPILARPSRRRQFVTVSDRLDAENDQDQARQNQREQKQDHVSAGDGRTYRHSPDRVRPVL
jgi:hypothetical protein